MSLRLAALLTVLVLMCAPQSLARDGVFGSDYAEVGRCGPFARVAVRTPAWACVGIVAGHQQGLIRPRNIIEVAPHRFIIADMFGWGDEGHRGRILQLDVTENGLATVTPIMTGQTLPHGLALGPDGLVYFAEPNQLWRFDPKSPKQKELLMFSGLPVPLEDNAHPLHEIAFDRDGSLIMSVGAPADRCEVSYGDFRTIQHPCAATDSDPLPRAALYRLVFDKPGGQIVKAEPIARGLRNSMALVVHPHSGLLLAADNSLDVFSRDPRIDPPDELNVIEPGRHYGWPYCSGKAIVTPEYANDHIDCSKFQAPTTLLPPHSAPLGMAYYTRSLFPQLTGKLIVGFHSLNPHPGNGHRIAVYDVAENGVPLPKPPLWLVDEWGEKPGLRPQGTPVGLTVASDGSIWFVEDANQTVMVMLRP